MYIMFPLTFIAIFWGIYDIYRILFKSNEVFQKGVYRLPPASWIFGEYFNPSALGPNPAPPKTEAEKAGSTSSFWPFRVAAAIGEIPIAAAGLVKDVGINKVKQVVDSSTAVVTDSIQAADTIVKTTAGPLAEAAEKASSAASKTAGLLEKLPTIAESVTQKISDKVADAAIAKTQSVTDKVTGSIDAASNSVASSVQGAANTVTGIAGSKVDSTLAKVMTGGAIVSSSVSSSSINPSVSSTVLIFSVVLLAFSGYVFYTMRKSFSKITEDDDSPPDPKPVRGASEQGRQGK
jgi:F0F1-type ATP synthase membrane subunit b/b'